MTELAVVSKTLLGSSAGGMGITSSNKTVQHGGKGEMYQGSHDEEHPHAVAQEHITSLSLLEQGVLGLSDPNRLKWSMTIFSSM